MPCSSGLKIANTFITGGLKWTSVPFREGNILKFYTFTKKSFLAALSLFCLVACSGGQSLDNQSYSRANEAADKRINVFLGDYSYQQGSLNFISETKVKPISADLEKDFSIVRDPSAWIEIPSIKNTGIDVDQLLKRGVILAMGWKKQSSHFQAGFP